MKKLLGVIAGVMLLVAAGYVASAFYIGKQVEAVMDRPYSQLAHEPNVKVVKRDYQRGLFASTDTVVIELFGDLFRAMGQTPPTLTSVSVITHGPAPRFSTLAAAIVDNETLLAVNGKPGQKFLSGRTVVAYDGTSTTSASGQAGAFDFADPLGTTHRVSWDAFAANAQFDATLSNYTTQFQMPRLEFAGEDGMRVSVSGIKADVKGTLVFSDEPGLYATTQRIAIDEISAKARFGTGAPLVMRRVTMETTGPVKGDFVDALMKTGAAEVRIDRDNYGPARMDLALRHVHARSLAKVKRALARLNQAGNAAQVDPMAAVQPFLDAAMELLQHEPEFVLERFSFTTPEGEVLVKANARLVGVTPDDPPIPMALMHKVEASTEVAIPEALYLRLGPKPVSMEAASAQAQMRQRQIAELMGQGYVVREGTMLKLKLAYQAGEVTVNGVPFSMASLMRPPQAMEPPVMPISPAHPRAPMRVGR